MRGSKTTLLSIFVAHHANPSIRYLCLGNRYTISGYRQQIMYMISSPLKRVLENSSDTSFMDFNVVASTGCPNEAAKPVLKPSCCLDSVDNLIKI